MLLTRGVINARSMSVTGDCLGVTPATSGIRHPQPCALPPGLPPIPQEDRRSHQRRALSQRGLSQRWSSVAI